MYFCGLKYMPMDSIKKIIYGKGIYTAIQKDDILKAADTKDGVCFAGTPPLDDCEKELWERFSFLRVSGYIKEVSHGTFKITEAGKQFLAEGGYEGMVKKEKVYIYAFHISVAAIVISLVSLFANMFGWFSRP